MARQKRSSTILKKAERRATGMRTIDPDLILGKGLKVKDFCDSVNDFHKDLIAYNALLSQLDKLRHSLDTKETKLAQLSERMLAAVGARYGRDSAEYEMAGGSKRRTRRRNIVAAADQSEAALEPTTDGPSPAIV